MVEGGPPCGIGVTLGTTAGLTFRTVTELEAALVGEADAVLPGRVIDQLWGADVPSSPGRG